MENKKRIMIIASLAKSLHHFRGDFIEDLVSAGYDVYAAGPDMDSKNAQIIKAHGATPVEFDLQRSGLNPIKDLKTISSLKKIIKEHHIDLVFPYTIKPVVYGSIAANALNVPVISLITGLGYTFSGMSSKAKLLQKVSQFLYKKALKTNEVVVLQNKDDYELFLEKNILSKSKKYKIVSGTGANLNKYTFRKKTNNGDKIIFVFVARLIKEKGIHLYVEAAKILKSKYPNAEFHILGNSPKGSPSAIGESTLKEEHENKNIVHHGWQNNMLDFSTKSDVFVLPSFYREGIPRSIIEALCVGMPIITTDAPGCRETVVKDKNGILIEPQSLDALVNAMEFFINNPDKVEFMGANSRKYAEDRFDVKLINKDLINLINTVLK